MGTFIVEAISSAPPGIADSVYVWQLKKSLIFDEQPKSDTNFLQMRNTDSIRVVFAARPEWSTKKRAILWSLQLKNPPSCCARCTQTQRKQKQHRYLAHRKSTTGCGLHGDSFHFCMSLRAQIYVSYECEYDVIPSLARLAELEEELKEKLKKEAMEEQERAAEAEGIEETVEEVEEITE